METDKVHYGIWTPGIGWVKYNNEPVAFEIEEVAISTAKRIGNNSRVEFIDNALFDLENQLLEAERNLKKQKLLEEKLAEEKKFLNVVKNFFNKKNRSEEDGLP